jgi:hypothetical protein
MSPDATPNRDPTQRAVDESGPEHPRPGALSKHDPPTHSPTARRPPLLLAIILVLLVSAVVVLHLTGVLGPGSH